jgi:hypothetical protein
MNYRMSNYPSLPAPFGDKSQVLKRGGGGSGGGGEVGVEVGRMQCCPMQVGIEGHSAQSSRVGSIASFFPLLSANNTLTKLVMGKENN